MHTRPFWWYGSPQVDTPWDFQVIDYIPSLPITNYALYDSPFSKIISVRDFSVPYLISLIFPNSITSTFPLFYAESIKADTTWSFSTDAPRAPLYVSFSDSDLKISFAI